MYKSIILALVLVAASALPTRPQEAQIAQTNEQTLSKIAELLADLRPKNNREYQLPASTHQNNRGDEGAHDKTLENVPNKTKTGPSMPETISDIIQLVSTQGPSGLATRNGMESVAYVLRGAASLLFRPYADMVQSLLSPALLNAAVQMLESYNKV